MIYSGGYIKPSTARNHCFPRQHATIDSRPACLVATGMSSSGATKGGGWPTPRAIWPTQRAIKEAGRATGLAESVSGWTEFSVIGHDECSRTRPGQAVADQSRAYLHSRERARACPAEG